MGQENLAQPSLNLRLNGFEQLPHALWVVRLSLFAVLAAQRERLLRAQAEHGDYISPTEL